MKHIHNYKSINTAFHHLRDTAYHPLAKSKERICFPFASPRPLPTPRAWSQAFALNTFGTDTLI